MEWNILFNWELLQVPEPTKQQCWGPRGVIWGAERAKFFGLVAHDRNSTLSLQFFLLRITLLSLSGKGKKIIN